MINNPKYLLVELCNYKNYPLGGHLSFAKQLIKAFGNELALVGITTDDEIPVGRWTKKNINGIDYDYYSVKRVYPSEKKGIIPNRIKAYFWSRKHKKNILAYGCNNIIIQTPEVFFNFKNHKNLNICLRLPGLGNPLRISRYAYGKLFAEIYENIFFKAINKANVLLAAADNDAISDFIKRSKNKFDKSKLIQFPTRFDDSIFYPKEKKEARNYIGVSDNDTLIVTSGRLNHFKGWKLMIDAFALFHENNNNSKFIFLGDGEDKAKIENYIFEKNLIRNVLLKGRVDHKILADYLNAADLFIMGSYAEGWSTSLVEAVACATPVCTTNFSSAKELVQDGINGFVLNNRDEMDFSQKMKEAVSLPKNGLFETAQEIKKFAVSNLKQELLNSWKINI
jgi:glycosyltransferase involved in cell wall biosynthesis